MVFVFSKINRMIHSVTNKFLPPSLLKF